MSAISDNTALLPIVSAELLSDCYQLQFERSQGLSFVLRRNFWACLSPKKESSALAFGGAEGSFLSTIASFPGHDACSLSCCSFRPSQAFGKQSKSVPQPWSTSGSPFTAKPHTAAHRANQGVNQRSSFSPVSIGSSLPTASHNLIWSSRYPGSFSS